jgi:catechol 2,3-dioxygenase
MSTLPLDIDDLLRASGGTPWTGMPAGTHIGHVHLHVGDIEQAALFYHDGLGLDKMVWNYPQALFLSAGGYHHHLGVNTWAGKDAARPSPDDSQLLEWELLLGSLPDVNTALDALADAGYPVERTADGGVAHDPWGTALRLRTRPRG